MADKVFTMRIDEELLEKVRVSAEKNHRSLAKEVEYILDCYFREAPNADDCYTSPEVDKLLRRLLELASQHGGKIRTMQDGE
jgi:hypothetical protein